MYLDPDFFFFFLLLLLCEELSLELSLELEQSDEESLEIEADKTVLDTCFFLDLTESTFFDNEKFILSTLADRRANWLDSSVIADIE